MDFNDSFFGILLGFLFTLVQLGFIPGVVAYFIARSRLQNGGKRLRGWKPALASVLVLIMGMYLSLTMDNDWDGIGIGILSFIAAGVLFGVAVGFTLAWLDNRPIDPFK